MNFADKLKNPDEVYARPMDVLTDPVLSDTERSQLLTQWRDQLEQLQTATDENMPPPGHRSDTGALLREVNQALSGLN